MYQAGMGSSSYYLFIVYEGNEIKWVYLFFFIEPASDHDQSKLCEDENKEN